MSRKEILSSPEYWIAKTQMDLYNCAEDFMESHDLNRTQLAAHLGVSKGYVSQLLNGDYDHKLSKLAELAIAFGYVPKIEFVSIEEVLSNDEKEYRLPDMKPNADYMPSNITKTIHINTPEDYEVSKPHFNINAA